MAFASPGPGLLSLIAAVAIALPLLASHGAQESNPLRGSPGPDLDLLEQTIGHRLDEVRREEGARPLTEHQALLRAAEERAALLADRRRLETSSAELTALERRLRRLGYRPHFFREAVLAGPLVPSQAARLGFGADLLRADLEHASVACAPRTAAARSQPDEVLCLILVAERQIRFDLRRAEPLRDLETVRAEVLDEVNRIRVDRGLAPLIEHRAANRAAQTHAAAMLAKDFYSHRGLDGRGPRQRAQAAGFSPRWIGENLAKVVTEPVDVVGRWLDSSDHRRNLLQRNARFHGLGVAVGVQDGDVVALWCQLIGS